MTDLLIPAVISCIVAFAVVFLMTPPLIRILEERNSTVKDVNKKGNVMVARPGGLAIIAGIVASEVILYAFLQTNDILAIIITTSAAFVIGYVDDRRVMGGWFKPVTLAVAAVPIIALGAYDPHLAFPLFGTVNIPVLYIVLVLFMIPITGNTVNSIDVLNGVASGFMVIASFSLTLCLLIVQNYEVAVISLPLGIVSLAFYKYHKIPSRIFPGDSGALTLGAMYGAIAIVGGVEIIAAVAFLPAVLNSFMFLSSVKRIVEHRQIKAKPVEHTDDFRLKATNEKKAPVTLVRLILAGGPMTERQIGLVIFKLGSILWGPGSDYCIYDGVSDLRNFDIFAFLLGMWALIIVGGGIVVVILGPISISGYGDLDYFLTSGSKAITAIVLVIIWIVILSKMKNLIFSKKFNF